MRKKRINHEAQEWKSLYFLKVGTNNLGQSCNIGNEYGHFLDKIFIHNSSFA